MYDVKKLHTPIGCQTQMSAEKSKHDVDLKLTSKLLRDFCKSVA